MSDTKDLIKLIKKFSVEAVASGQPMNLVYGNVVGVEPLSINIDQRLTLDEKQLVLSRAVTDYSIFVTMDWQCEIGGESEHEHELEIESNDGGSPSHTHNIDYEMSSEDLEHIHNINGKKEILIHNSLKSGENVILLRMQGGQKFLVLDRVVGL